VKQICLLVVLFVALFAVTGCGGDVSGPTDAGQGQDGQGQDTPQGEAPADTGDGETPADGVTIEGSGNIAVFADSTLTEAFEEIKRDIESANSKVQLSLTFIAMRSLPQGAPADVYAPSSTEQMDAAMGAGQVMTGTAEIFAQDQLIMVVNRERAATVTTVEDLALPGLNVALVSGDMPAGRYTVDFLGQVSQAGTADFREQVFANVASYEQTVGEVLASVESGEADAGIVYRSSITKDLKNKIATVEIPSDVNVLVSYPIAVVETSNNPTLAEQFVAYVLSDEGQATLEAHGLLPAPQE
jgi:molybdate transport system substrate-binding protein